MMASRSNVGLIGYHIIEAGPKVTGKVLGFVLELVSKRKEKTKYRNCYCIKRFGMEPSPSQEPYLL